MHDLRDYKTLTPKQITAAISQLNHNTAPKIMTHLALRARQPHPLGNCLLYTSPSPRDGLLSRMPSSA